LPGKTVETCGLLASTGVTMVLQRNINTTRRDKAFFIKTTP
jgi:hypothetical protein